MDKEKSTALFSFETEIEESGEINYPKEKLKELRVKGFNKVDLVVYGSSRQAVVEKELDLDLFNNIKDLQGLPDTVVLDFMSSKGALKNSGIESRI